MLAGASERESNMDGFGCASLSRMKKLTSANKVSTILICGVGKEINGVCWAKCSNSSR